jgi:hypothetical protein
VQARDAKLGNAGAWKAPFSMLDGITDEAADGSGQEAFSPYFC